MTTKPKELSLAYDLDGTLYDTLPLIFGVDREVRHGLGYNPITLSQYRDNFQTSDWNRFYRELGIREEDLGRVIDLFVQGFKKVSLPPLISRAKETLEESARVLGIENVYIITNEPKEKVSKRFERDGLLHFLGQVHTPFEGKSQEIYTLAQRRPTVPFAYVGDLVSDGEACLEAVKMGAENVSFCGIIHPQSFNTEEAIKNFVLSNPDHARIIENLSEVSKLWKNQ